MSNNVEQMTITCNGENFIRGTYNGIAVLIREKDGFINATDMCNQFNKRFRKIFENHSWQAYYEVFRNEYYGSPGMGEQEQKPIYQLNKGFSVKENYLRGTYVDPRLTNYICFWASPAYAIYVGKIMDSINDKVHEVLNEKQLQDTPENAKPVFVEVAQQIAPSINQELINKQCWGYRDSVKTLDQWEQEDLNRDINEYIEIKRRLEEVERKVDSWSLFVKQYHPEFEK